MSLNETDRAADRILLLPEIAERTRLTIDSLRWLRHCRTGPKTFRLGRRVVAWESDVLAWIEEQSRAQDPTPAA